MTRGPKPGTRHEGVQSSLERATRAWGMGAPEWVAALCEACDAPGSSQSKVAKLLGYTPSAISQVINNKYSVADFALEEKVRGRFMSQTVECPIAGELRRDLCQKYQVKKTPASSSGLAAIMRHCRSGQCPHLKGGL